MRWLIFIAVILMICSGCQDNCMDKACFTPPHPFNFEIIGKQSGKDLLSSGTYNYDQVSVMNQETGETVTFNSMGSDSIKLIGFDNIGWKTEVIDYVITIADTVQFGLYVDATRTNENCCSFTRYNDVKIKYADYKLDSLNGIYKILIAG